MEPDRTLQRLRRLGVVLIVAACVLGVVALWLSVDNPTISGTGRDDYRCLAPWDTVLNDAGNEPGGEPSPEGYELAARCREAGEQRFETAVTVGVAAGGVAVVAGLVGLLVYRRDRRPRS